MQGVVEGRAGEGGGGGGGKTGGFGLMPKGSLEENGGGEGEGKKSEVLEVVAGHPYDFHVSGPRNISSPNWRDLMRSSWRDPNYRRTVMACFIQAVYLLELDRQERRTKENGLAPQWWKPFKYKLTKTLVDGRDGSVYGAVLERERSAALSDLILLRPNGAPKAVLALRGTLLKSPTIRRDIEDDLRFLAWESLKGSVRFHGALEALKTVADRFGSNNVCIGGHSLGAGFALQVGKALAKQGVFVECHVFNPPSVSMAMSVRIISEKAGFLWKKIKARLPSKHEVLRESEEEASGNEENKLQAEIKKWVPNLYVNNSDYICCYYIDSAGTAVATSGGSNKTYTNGGNGDIAAKLFVMSKGPKKFLEAHGLEQWWADDMELQLALQNSKLINRQLRSLYTTPPTLPPGKS
ncbi:GDSL esterase/lipase At4g10955-like [Phoenix dactylifera]|uniref:GDSL esterase/lipase At4g10955-like n=1 Tax=Phoenix dactylifera TaxID=42345 RepID=A0A8B8J7Q2_PHODC|nr:GDSL esterase/lipase At4g10955-like [Phoenix dactylifera]